MQARYRGIGLCLAVAMAAMVIGTVALTANSSKDRTISLYNIHSKETLTIQYMKAGKHVPEAMEKVNWMLRDWRRDEATRMDPDLIDLMWEIHNELGSAEPIHIISGYRSKGTNEMLRRTVGGQASQSRHILGQAADVHFPDVPIKKLRYSALIRERGGVGYYPTSAIPFVHLDIDRVRAWPRLPRNELALLFPNGRTQHLPEDGDPISMDDVKRARAANTELAQQIAEYPSAAHASQERGAGRLAHAVAAATAGAASPGRAAVGARHASERSGARQAGRACGRSAASEVRAEAGQPQGAGSRRQRRPGRVSCGWRRPILARTARPCSGCAKPCRSARTSTSCRRLPTTRSTRRSCPTGRSRSRRC